ncbi:MAG TPA: TonB-dependent receptor [Opitutaceae bacterium]|nr:TonB-dependent receptor [Opitutaceae bacterium]
MKALVPPVRAVSAVLLATALPVIAQVAAPTSNTTATADATKKEETVTLSPFEVHPDENRGYVASETMTGTRVATQIKDLPYTVNVVTSEYFEDFAMFQLDDSLTQIGGLTSLDVGGGFTLRGFPSTSQLRDGFYRLGRYGQTNIDRLEIIKGPNAGIYGRTSPGGMVNMISKSPKKKREETLTLRYGSFDTAQATLEATGTLISPSTSYIAIFSQFNRGADMDWFHIRENQGFVALKHDFKNGGHLLASAEYFMQYRDAPTSAAPMIIDQKNTASTADDEVIGYAKNLARYNAFGPNSELNRGSNTGYITYDQKLNDVFSVRLGGQIFQAKRWDYNQNTGFGSIAINSTNPATNLVSTRGATPNRGLIFEAGGGVQWDNIAQYNLFNGAVANKTLVTLDFNDYYRYDPTRNSGAVAAIAEWTKAGSGRVIALNPDYTPISPLTYFSSSLDAGGQGALTRYTRRRATVFGGQFRQESHWMKDSLLTYFGVRFDDVHFHERDYIAVINGVKPTIDNPNSVAREVTQAKPNVGALYKVTQNFRVYANYSESYFVDQTDNPANIADANYKPETAKGYDYGIKGSFFDDRLNYTIGGYYIERANVRVIDLVETPVGSGNYVSIVRPDGDQLDRGFEADVNWNINRNFSTGLSYGHVKAIYTDFGSAFPEVVGRSVQNVAPSNGSVYIKYSGTEGWLKGFSANLGVTFVERTHTEAPNAGDTTAVVNGTTVVTASTGQYKLTIPSFTLWNVGVSYELKQREKFAHKIRLNVNNVFDLDYLKINKNIGDGRGIYLSYEVSFTH